MSARLRAATRRALLLASVTAMPAFAQGTAVPATTLDQVVVTGTRITGPDSVGPVRGYQALTSDTATRTDTPLREIPQSVTVVPRRLVEEQGIRNVEEALRNVAGVTSANPLFFNQTLQTRVRGFSADFYRDGLSSFFDAGLSQSIIGIERIEVLKGPTANLFGGGYGGGLGGAVNVVTRRPQPGTFGELGVRLGPSGYRQGFLDLNASAGAGNGVVALGRVGAEALHSRQSDVDGVTTDGYNVLPSVTLRRDDTSLTIQAFFSERRANEYPGLPVVGTIVPRTFAPDRSLNVSGPNVPRTVSQRNGVGATFEAPLDDAWTLRLQGRYTASNLEEPTQILFGGAPTAAGTFSRVNAILIQDLNQATALPTLTGRFTTGPASHVLLVGGEFDETTDRGGTGFAFSDLFDVTRPTLAPYVRPAVGTATDNTYSTVAGFVQDQVTLWDRVRLLGALRVTDLTIDSRNATGAGFTASTTRVTPRAGASLDVTPGLTVFAGYGEGIRGNPYVRLPTGTPRPEESRQWEVGVKADLGFGLSGTAALFDISRTNVPIADPNVLFAQRQSGEQRSRGGEVEFLFQPDRSLSLLAAYAYQEVTIVRDTALARGTDVPFVPRQTLRTWGAYRFADAAADWLRPLTIGAGTFTSAGAVAETATRARTKGFTTFDASIAYDAGPFRVALTGRNLAHRRYLVPYEYLSGAVAPGAGRAAFLTASVRF